MSKPESSDMYNLVIDSLIDSGFTKLDLNNKGYITRQDIQTKYKFNKRDTDTIMKAFDPNNLNMVDPAQFKTAFKKLLDELY